MDPRRNIRQSIAMAATAVAVVMISVGAYLSVGTAIASLKRKMVDDERGEGPVSAAIVVMIMAFLGVALWIAFKAIMHQATTTVATQVSQLGQ